MSGDGLAVHPHEEMFKAGVGEAALKFNCFSRPTSCIRRFVLLEFRNGLVKLGEWGPNVQV